MRLTELEPRWISDNVFVFRCPHCRIDWLSCKDVVLGNREQRELFELAFGEDWNLMVVPTREECAWNIIGRDFATMHVTPSLNAEASGHWHGHITGGEII